MPQVNFDDKVVFIYPPTCFDFFGNDATWHATWYTPEEIKEQSIRYITSDREVPLMAGPKALFRAKSIALECNTFDKRRPRHFGTEFIWPVVWQSKLAFHANSHIVNGEVDYLLWD